MNIFGKAALFAAGAAALVANPALADEDAFRVGGIVSLSGAYGVIGESMRKGAELAAEARGGTVLGAPIVFEWEDTETNPQIAVQKASALMGKGVDMLFGAVSSGSTLAVMKVSERRGVPLIVTLSASDRITGEDMASNTFRTSNPVRMENTMMAEFVGREKLGKIYAVVADYGVGRDMWDDLKGRLDAVGAEIVAEDYPPLGGRDYALIIDKIKKTDADGVVMIMTGGDAITFLKQSGQVGLKDEKQIFGTMGMDEMMGEAVGDLSYGVNSTLRYHFAIDNDVNRAFVESYVAKYGVYPDQAAGEAYDGMAWFLDVVEETGVWDQQAWIKAFSTSTNTKSLEGVKVMRACDHQAAQSGIFGKAIKGEAPHPNVTMEISYQFDSETLFPACD